MVVIRHRARHKGMDVSRFYRQSQGMSCFLDHSWVHKVIGSQTAIQVQGSSLGSAARADGQTVVFTLLGDEMFTYTVPPGGITNA